MITSVLLSLFFVISFVFADFPLPNTPVQFSADIKIITYLSGGSPVIRHGSLYYDFLAQKVRTEEIRLGNRIVTMQDFSTMYEYDWDTYSQKCSCGPLDGLLNPFHVPLGSIYRESTNVGMTYVDLWEARNPALWDSGVHLHYYVDPINNHVVKINDTTSAGTRMIELSNIKVGPQENTVFEPIAACDKSCPYRPTPPEPGTCPDKAGYSCKCFPAASLMFCNKVNYPVSISTVYNAKELDFFVGQIYNKLFEDISNPSQDCQDSYLQYLCASHFPQCASGNSLGYNYLPCSGNCPTCACGPSLNMTCTSPSSSDSYCTQYGSNFCGSS